MAVAVALVAATAAGTARADASLSVEPLTWNIIGLDSNDVSSGPNQFLVGARACNSGDGVATDSVAELVWGSQNPLIELAGPATIGLGDIAAGTCADAYFLVAVERDPAAFDTTREFRIDVTADGLATVSTPTPRELLVERLISQNRNDAISLIGPAEVFVGQTITFDVVASTATNGYEQLQNFLPLPHGMFSIVAIEQTYSAPPGATNDRPYADACGWDADPTSPTYRECVGPVGFPGGKAGGELTTRYVVEVVGTGTATLADLIYDFSGSSYHYNADFGAPSLTVVAREPIDLELAKVASEGRPALGEVFTYTLTLTNRSTTDATGVAVTDTFPAGVEVQAGQPSAGTFDATTGVWSVGALAAGESETLQVDVVATNEGTLTNVAEVTAADQPDLDSTPDNAEPGEDDLGTSTVTAVTEAPTAPPTTPPTDGPTAPPTTPSTPPPGDASSPGAGTGALPNAGELPRTGAATDPLSLATSGALTLTTGMLMLTIAHRRERRQRIRAIDRSITALLRAERTGELWATPRPFG